MKNALRFITALALLTAVTFVHAEKQASPTDVSGKWNFEIVTDQGSGNPTFTFVQDGEDIKGDYNGLFGQAPVTGTVKGDTITFSLKVDVEGQQTTIVYSGAVSGDTMKGTVKFGEMGNATFTGKRASK
ncbi:MAG TPA: hypothetical protein VMM36_03495 [Opitutaceae bacterium]|nr:hypothetical protein [Opitutaceae bacterium]